MNRKSKYLIFFFAVLLYTACEDNQSQKKLESSSEETKTDSVKNLTPPKENSKQDPPTQNYPVLNDKTAMEFFLEYDKHHKENKIRIYIQLQSLRS